MAITGRHITTIAKVIAPWLLRPLPLEQFRDRGGPARHDAVVPGSHAVAARIGSHTPRGGAAVVVPIDGRHVPRALAATTQAEVAASLVGAAALHVGWAKRVDAVRQTVSDYALDEDANKVFTATVACLSVASMSLLASVVRSRFPVGIAPTALLGTWCAGLALCAAFRTDPIDSPPTVDGVVHRCACAVAVAALPSAGLLVARRTGRLPALKSTARALRVMSWASTAAGAVFLGTHVCAQAPAIPAARSIGNRHGLAERVPLALELGVLCTLAGTVRVGQART
ncbi:DUF998 domain-containing protein [Streptomyces sp. NPDC048825]|uniref:DUF998 domain-containing protein n=1 Tax=Streptomyces sp. NPDC048825 TaxID=3365592 RepID=UPI0037207B6A